MYRVWGGQTVRTFNQRVNKVVQLRGKPATACNVSPARDDRALIAQFLHVVYDFIFDSPFLSAAIVI